MMMMMVIIIISVHHHRHYHHYYQTTVQTRVLFDAPTAHWQCQTQSYRRMPSD